jgi:hypothetical protein
LRAEKSAARRAAILKAALDEFCERGFAATWLGGLGAGDRQRAKHAPNT